MQRNVGEGTGKKDQKLRFGHVDLKLSAGHPCSDVRKQRPRCEIGGRETGLSKRCIFASHQSREGI